MSTHSYSRCWLHLIWETLRHEPMLDKRAAPQASANLSQYSYEKGIYMKINYFNADHTHALIDLPTNKTIEEVIHLFKGSSSHWINENRLIKGRFAWAAATERSLSRIQMWKRLRITVLVRKSITGSEPLPTSTSYSSSDTGWNGATRETVENGYTNQRSARVHPVETG